MGGRTGKSARHENGYRSWSKGRTFSSKGEGTGKNENKFDSGSRRTAQVHDHVEGRKQ